MFLMAAQDPVRHLLLMDTNSGGNTLVAFLHNPKFQQVTVNLLRIVAGLLFMQHGAQKLFGLFGGDQMPLLSLMGLAGVLEFWGGLLVVLGLFTAPVTLVLTVEMIVAYFTAHLPRGFWPIQNQGELALLYASIFLFVAASGGGSFSLDGRLRRRTGAEASEPASGALPAD